MFILKRVIIAAAVACSLVMVAGCGDSNPGQPVTTSEADQQSKLTEQGLKSGSATDEASKQNQLTGGSGGQPTQGK